MAKKKEEKKEEKIDKIIEIIPIEGKEKFKLFSSGKINISFDGEPPYLVKESEFAYISDWFEIYKTEKKPGGK